MSPNITQWDDAIRHYLLDILKAKKVAVLGDNTGYGTTATAASVASFQKAGAEVVYSEVIDANAQDVSPNMLHARDAGAQAIACWSDSTGLDARMMNARGRIGWDVRHGRPSRPGLGRRRASAREAGILGQGLHRRLPLVQLTTPTASCRRASQAFVDEVKGKIELQDTSLWWVTGGSRCA